MERRPDFLGCVETHQANLMRKLNLRSQTNLNRLAILLGLPPEK
jgi:hypothetical protein